MKRLLAIAFIVLLSGCEVVVSDGETDPADRFRTLRYGNHSYVVFEHYRTGGIVHDPDCPCRWLEVGQPCRIADTLVVGRRAR